jgi:hypothetical protein
VAAQLGLANVAWRWDEPDDAIDCVERLLADLPGDQIRHGANALLLLGDIEHSRYHYDRAAEYLRLARSRFAEFGDWRSMIMTDQRSAWQPSSATPVTTLRLCAGSKASPLAWSIGDRFGPGRPAQRRRSPRYHGGGGTTWCPRAHASFAHST